MDDLYNDSERFRRTVNAQGAKISNSWKGIMVRWLEKGGENGVGNFELFWEVMFEQKRQEIFLDGLGWECLTRRRTG